MSDNNLPLLPTMTLSGMYSYRDTKKGMVGSNSCGEIEDIGVEKMVETSWVLYSQISDFSVSRKRRSKRGL